MECKRIDYEKVKELYDPTLTDRENAHNTGVSISTFSKWRRSNGYQSVRSFRKPVEKIVYAEFKKLYDLGKSDKAIAESLGFAVISIWEYRNRHNIPTNHPRVRVSMSELEAGVLPTLSNDEKPWHDPESLYCDKAFLEKLKAGTF